MSVGEGVMSFGWKLLIFAPDLLQTFPHYPARSDWMRHFVEGHLGKPYAYGVRTQSGAPSVHHLTPSQNHTNNIIGDLLEPRGFGEICDNSFVSFHWWPYAYFSVDPNTEIASA